MEIILRRTLLVTAYKAVATIGKEDEEFRFLFRALELAGENGDFATPATINTSLVFLPPGHEMGRRILSTLEKYKLILNTDSYNSNSSSEYELTELGKQVLSKGTMMIPEKGPCILNTIDDPLFPDNIAGCEYIEQRIHSEYDQAYSAVRNNGDKAQQIEDPRWLRSYPKDMSKEDPEMIEAIAMGERIIIYEIERPLIPLDKSNMSLTVNVVLNQNGPAEVKVRSNTKDKSILVASHNFRMSYEDVLQELLTGMGRELVTADSGELIMLSAFDDLTSDEQNRMTFDHVFEKPDIRGFGRSLDVRVKGIRILPKTKKDAVKWTSHLLMSRIDNYVDCDSFEQLRDECAGQFSETFPVKEILKSVAGYEKFLAMVKEHREENPRLFFLTHAPMLLTAERS